MLNPVYIESSNIKAIAWEDDNLYVLFNQGVWYVYYGVGAENAMLLLMAESRGSFLNKFIKPEYLCEQITQAEAANLFSA